MTFWGAISRWADRPAVRKHGPVALSLCAHAAAGLVAMAAIAVSARQPETSTGPVPREEKIIELSLGAETLPLPAAPMPPAPRPASQTHIVPKLDGEDALGAAPIAPADEKAEEDGVAFGGTPEGLARGLASVSGSDPCRPKHGSAPEGCGPDWARTLGSQPSLMAPTRQEQTQQYAEFMPKCPWNVGCEKKEWISTNGTRSVGGPAPGSRNDHGSSTPMAAGAAGLGGLHDSVGRLGFNPDHFDRGFGD